MTSAPTGSFLAAFSVTISDPKRSVPFYEALGFRHCGQKPRTVEPGDFMAEAMGLPGAKMCVDYMARPDGRLELMSFEEPQAFGEGALKPVNRTGLNAMHLGFEDANVVVKRLVELGGTIVAGVEGRYVVADPDGVRIHCMNGNAEALKAVFGE